MAEKYYSILTNRGKELEAQSSVSGKPVIIKDFVVGDGNGQVVKPDPAQVKLVREVYRNTISALQISPDQANQFIAQLVLAAGVGGFVVREAGLLTDAGELYSVANCPAIEKPENGVSVNLQYRLAVSETANIELKVATGDGLFLRIDKNLTEIAAKGQAAQKSAREALDVVDATVSRKGLVQLSSATDSTSEVLAATPKAVKAVSDELASVKKSLGTASGKDVVASNTDTTEGRLPVVGWQGLGAQSGPGYTDANIPNVNCFFRMNAEGIHGPVAGAPSNILQFQYDINAGQQIGYRAGVQNAPMKHRSKVNAVWGEWAQVFDTLNPPTAKQVGAMPYSGTLLSSIYDLTITDVLTALGAGASSPTVGMPANSGNTRFTVYATQIYDGQFWVMLVSRDQNYTGQVNTTNKTVNWQQFYNTSNKPAAADVDAVSASKGGAFAKEVQFTEGLSVRSATGIYSGNDAAGFVSNNMLLKSWYGIGFYCTMTGGEGLTGYINTRNGQLEMKGQIIPGNYSNFDGRFYTKTLADATFQPKGSYAAPNKASIGTNSWFQDTGTGYMHQSGLSGTVSSGGTVTFPVPFTSKCTAVNANTYNASGSGAVMIQSMSNTGFTFAVSGGYTGQLVWNAMGR
ncbi:phage tail protein [Enterobacter soli]|uniref:phage tail protein n=1 Tax=Enterobacter soli TaxID=885040 RepID=UPI0023785A56|nr:phage tail protein [Enterobacter soli]MDD9245217.1 phage tail protein [Enterobacter soli]